MLDTKNNETRLYETEVNSDSISRYRKISEMTKIFLKKNGTMGKKTNRKAGK